MFPASSDPALRLARLRRCHERGLALLESGDRAAAAAEFRQGLALDSQHVGCLVGLARCELEEERHQPARTLAMRALRGRLESPRSAIELLGLLAQLSESGLIREIVRQIPPERWDSPRSLTEVAQILSLMGIHEEARQFIEAARARGGEEPATLVMYATVMLFFGEFEPAYEACERCLEKLPFDPSAHWLISRLRRPDPLSRVPRIERALAHTQDLEDRAMLAYALHNELHEAKDYERAWAALMEGCRAKRRALGYRPERMAEIFALLRSWSEEEIRREDGFRGAVPVPIFVIGLHRSGTTLAERILSGHSQIAQGGETYDLRGQLRRASGLHYPAEIDPRIIEARAAIDYRAIGEGYVRGIAWRARGKPYVTEKLPSNYFNLGFIARALPEAKFIVLERDPIDIGLSSLRTLFSHACPYSYDPLDYAQYWRWYQELMDHWQRLLPERILEVDYQRLVDAPEAVAREMCAFVGVDYEPSMLAIEERKDAVSTASSVMMREGIRKDRGRLWAAYARWLEPMIEALGQAA
jgi:thioredoxin-like negative regulator of GroEL